MVWAFQIYIKRFDIKIILKSTDVILKKYIKKIVKMLLDAKIKDYRILFSFEKKENLL